MFQTSMQSVLVGAWAEKIILHKLINEELNTVPPFKKNGSLKLKVGTIYIIVIEIGQPTILDLRDVTACHGNRNIKHRKKKS